MRGEAAHKIAAAILSGIFVFRERFRVRWCLYSCFKLSKSYEIQQNRTIPQPKTRFCKEEESGGGGRFCTITVLTKSYHFTNVIVKIWRLGHDFNVFGCKNHQFFSTNLQCGKNGLHPRLGLVDVEIKNLEF